MNIFRIKAECIEGLTAHSGQTLELVAGFTPQAYVAAGNWFGVVNDGLTIYPFVLTDDGHCRYSGDHSFTRYFSNVKRPVKVGEIFELTWDDHNDKHCYKIISVQRLNTISDEPVQEPHSPCATPADCDETKEPSIFIRNELIWDAQRPEALKENIGALIDAGNVVAVGENSVERVFATAASFKDWFDKVMRGDKNAIGV